MSPAHPAGRATSPAPATAAGRPAALSWSTISNLASTGVLRLDVTTCRGAATATGFLVAPDLVATVAHAVEGSSSIRVTSPSAELAVAGQVVGLDHDHDLALIRTARPLPGHVFPLTAQQPAVGTEIGILGFPYGRWMQLTMGRITAQHDDRSVSDGNGFDARLTDLLLTDGAMHPGNSGGPWLRADGHVVALAESGPPFVQGQQQQRGSGGVPVLEAAADIAGWRSHPAPVAATACAGLLFAPREPDNAALTTLATYLSDINQEDFASAYAQWAPGTPPASSEPAFFAQHRTSQNVALGTAPSPGNLFDLVDSRFQPGTGSTAATVVADVTFQTTRAASAVGSGPTCISWSLRYTFVEVSGVWLVRDSRATPGSVAFHTCRPATGR